jgi:hypothetical protein
MESDDLIPQGKTLWNRIAFDASRERSSSALNAIDHEQKPRQDG